VSPILVRPVREQLEHDRVIRLLHLKLKRRHDVVANIGPDQTVPVKIGPVMIYPDLVLSATDKGKKLEGTVEVETAESVNHLEAMAQWAHLGRARVPFHLYVPANCVEIARRLAAENDVRLTELWSYHTIGDQTRFTLVQKNAPPAAGGAKKTAAAVSPKPAAAAKKRAAVSPKPAAAKARPAKAERKKPTATPKAAKKKATAKSTRK
jgi:hypothetical protein